MTSGQSQFRFERARGQATIEFALILIVLLAVLYGIIEISRLLLVSAQIQNAAKEGAHYASLHPCERAEDIRTNAIEPRLTLVDSSFTVSRTLATEAPRSTLQMGSPITITLLYTWTSYVNIMPDMSTLTLRPLGPLVLHGQGVDLIENPGTLAIPCP